MNQAVGRQLPVRLSGARTPMLPNMSDLPCEHRHVLDSDTDLRCDVQQTGVNFAMIEHAIEKRPSVRYQIEQKGESVAAE